MRTLILAACAALVCGCIRPPSSDSDAENAAGEVSATATASEAQSSEPQTSSGPGTAGAVAGIAMPDAFDSAAGGGQSAPAPSTPANAQPTAASFGSSAAKLVNAQVAMQDNRVVEVTNGITASDPLSASIQGYFSASSKLLMIGFQNQLRTMKALNDNKNLSFDQFAELAQQMRVEFAPLPPWQMIGYDESTGKVLLLEDKGEKIRRFKSKGIPIDAADKQYDTE